MLLQQQHVGCHAVWPRSRSTAQFVYLLRLSVLLLRVALLWHTKQSIWISSSLNNCIRIREVRWWWHCMWYDRSTGKNIQLCYRALSKSSSPITAVAEIYLVPFSVPQRVLAILSLRLSVLPLLPTCFPMNTGTWNAGTTPFPVAVWLPEMVIISISHFQ